MTKRKELSAHPASQPGLSNRGGLLFLAKVEETLIDWPTEQQIQEVSTRLAAIRRMGVRLEAAGDYFNSGDLAYQIHDLVRTTEALLKRSQRIKQ